MQSSEILILVSTIVFLLLLWSIVGVRHLKNLRKAIKEQWEVVDERLRKRQNLVPNLVETVRWYQKNQESSLEDLIEDRSSAAKEYFTGAKKIELEHELTDSINKVMALAEAGSELARDTNFLELKTEIDDLELEIEAGAKKYNEMVRYYNNQRQLFLLRPLSMIFGFRIANIFEVER